MQRYYRVGMLLLVLAGAVVYYIYTTNSLHLFSAEEESASSTVDKITTVPENWKLHTSPRFDFAFYYPPGSSITTEAGRVKVRYLGPDNTYGSEITDGFVLFVRSITTDTDSVAAVAEKLFVEASNGVDSEAKLSVAEKYGAEAYTFTVRSMLGSVVTHVVVELATGKLVEVTYTIAGDTDGKYQRDVDMLVRSLYLQN